MTQKRARLVAVSPLSPTGPEESLPEPAAAEPEVAPAPLSSSPVVVESDGRTVVLEAKDEIVLRCGASSITLRRDGKVVIRGLYVETHAEGTNRVKGATVKIN